MTFDSSRRDFIKHVSATAAASSLFTAPVFAADKYVNAETTLGKIRGLDEDGIKTFKGIPYGADTSGANRFMPPKPASKWAGVKDTMKYGFSAPQNEPGKPAPTSDVAVAGAGLTAEGEDCLVLNIWTQGINDGRKRPVMFWCHGGGFTSGSGSSPITAGHNLAKRGDVVVVTVNHRLNVMGFANLSTIGSDFGNSGDVGMMDLVMALNWVKNNITQFGGDPNMVTIFGQSGGGRKVATLLAMPSAKGLFHRAIVESGPAIKLVDQANGARTGQMLLTNLGLTKANARDIQKLPVARIMTAYYATTRAIRGDQMQMGFAPNVGGPVLPQHPFSPNASPISADVPLMIGNARTELTTRADDAAFTLDAAGLKTRIAKQFGADADQLIDVYTRANPGLKPSEIYFLITSDNAYGAGTMKIAERRAALGKAPVYLYYFAWKSPMNGGKYLSPHTIEIPFAWDTIKEANLTKNSPVAQALADKVSAAWIAFARTGNPNVASLPKWPVFEPNNRPTMVFDNVSKIVNDPIKAQRLAMWNVMKL